MCGVVGFWDPRAPYDFAEVAQQMHQCMSHRGPDAAGVWQSRDMGLCLAHRRLAIMDLSPAGHQPMTSDSQRFTLVFNGEIYNHLELRAQLERSLGKIAWRGHSDTETLLKAFEQWGFEPTLKKLVGMFAIALFDAQTQQLHLARDRFGEKPLYWGWQGQTLLFASELKALRPHPKFNAEIDRDVLNLYFRHNCIPAPYSIYQGIAKLEAGHCLTLPLAKGVSVCQQVTSTPYWSLQEVCAQREMFIGTEAQAIDALDIQLRQAIEGQMHSDVPLGAFLSGGVDSTTIVALMQSMSERPVQTFTIGFEQGDYNEAEHAQAVAQHLGTEHHQWYIQPKDALDVIAQIPHYWDEPFSDSSQVPTFLVSKLAKQHVTVSLSGDGGDELFAGYNRHLQAPKLWQKLDKLPHSLRRGAGTIMGVPGADRWDKLYSALAPVLPKRLQMAMPGYKIDKLAGLLSARSQAEIYQRLVSHFYSPTQLVLNSKEPSSLLDQGLFSPLSGAEWLMAMDSVTYMSDDILTKVDRASMALSLESRVPFLDHRLVEFAWSLPLEMKLKQGQGKWILRQVLNRYVPETMMARPKQGFSIPLDMWLRTELKDWGAELLQPSKIEQQGFLNSAMVAQMWQQHQSGQRNWKYQLWDILMWQAWLEESHFAA